MDASPFGALAAKITGVTFNRRTRALLQRGDSSRTGQPVWRNSYTVGQIEKRIWKPINGGAAHGGKRWNVITHFSGYFSSSIGNARIAAIVTNKGQLHRRPPKMY